MQAPPTKSAHSVTAPSRASKSDWSNWWDIPARRNMVLGVVGALVLVGAGAWFWKTSATRKEAFTLSAGKTVPDVYTALTFLGENVTFVSEKQLATRRPTVPRRQPGPRHRPPRWGYLPRAGDPRTRASSGQAAGRSCPPHASCTRLSRHRGHATDPAVAGRFRSV